MNNRHLITFTCLSGLSGCVLGTYFQANTPGYRNQATYVNDVMSGGVTGLVIGLTWPISVPVLATIYVTCYVTEMKKSKA